MRSHSKNNKLRSVSSVKTDSTHPPPGLFTKSASTIARTLASKKSHTQRSRVRDADAELLY